MIANMDAVLVRDTKRQFGGGLVVEIVVWELPAPVPGSRHRYKYRLFFGRSDERIVGYDNERGKGDHRHLGNRELPYVFVDIDVLLADFQTDINAWRARQ